MQLMSGRTPRLAKVGALVVDSVLVLGLMRLSS
jgi:hypothetical protein